EKSFARRFVALGVNVLASLKRVDDKFCEFFFPAFYRYWLPNGLMSDMDLGSAIRMAATDWKNRDKKNGEMGPGRDLGPTISPVEDSLDTFVLFGDPSLQIRLL